MSTFKQYRRIEKVLAELRPYVPGELFDGDIPISISVHDVLNGSPKPGDMIARNPKNHLDQWLVSAEYFKDNFEEIIPPSVKERYGMFADPAAHE